jgi:hypothetical protein
VDYGPFIKSQFAPTQLTSRPCMVQIWSRYPPESGGNETFVVHRVDWVSSSGADRALSLPPPLPRARSLSLPLSRFLSLSLSLSLSADRWHLGSPGRDLIEESKHHLWDYFQGVPYSNLGLIGVYNYFTCANHRRGLGLEVFSSKHTWILLVET